MLRSVLPRRYAAAAFVAILASILSACGSGAPSPEPAPGPGPTPTTYTIGGTVSGLSGTVVLQNSGGNNLSIASAGAFTFSAAVASGGVYGITVLTQPAGQTCSITGGNGTVGTANVTTVAVTCTNNTFTVGGTVSGLAAGQNVVLQNNGAGSVNLIANGAFTFTNSLLPGAMYNATIISQPIGQVCAIAGGSGTMTAANVTSVAVTCSAAIVGFTVGGTVSGLGVGKTLVLRVLADGGSGTLAVTSNGPFTMPVGNPDGAEYEMFIMTQPVDQLCKVAQGYGDIAGANVTNVVVTCISKAVGAKNWGIAGVLSERTSVELLPKIAVSSNGDAIAVWESIRIAGIERDLYYSRYTVGSGWSAPADIGAGANRRNPNVAIDANGNAIAVWKGPAGGEGFDVYASRYTPGVGWSQSERIHANHPDFFDDASPAEIEMDSNGNAIVVWAGAYGVQYNRYTVGVGWESPAVHRILQTLGSSIDTEPELAVNARGDAIAVWQEHPGLVGEKRLWSTRYSVDTGTWAAPQVVDPNPGIHSAFANNVALAANGDATAVWTHFDGTRLLVKASRNVAGTWSTPVNVETNIAGISSAYETRVAIDGAGVVFAMWRQQFNETDGFYRASRFVPAIGVWQSPTTIGDYVRLGSHNTDTTYDIAANAAGNAVVVWTLSPGEDTENVLFPADVWSNQYVAGSGWSIPEIIGGTEELADPGASANPSVGIDGSGNAMAVWEGQSSTQEGDIFHNRMQ